MVQVHLITQQTKGRCVKGSGERRRLARYCWWPELCRIPATSTTHHQETRWGRNRIGQRWYEEEQGFSRLTRWGGGGGGGWIQGRHVMWWQTRVSKKISGDSVDSWDIPEAAAGKLKQSPWLWWLSLSYGDMAIWKCNFRIIAFSWVIVQQYFRWHCDKLRDFQSFFGKRVKGAGIGGDIAWFSESNSLITVGPKTTSSVWKKVLYLADQHSEKKLLPIFGTSTYLILS